MIEAWDDGAREEIEYLRITCWNIAVYGNSDRRKLKTIQKWWPLPWEKDNVQMAGYDVNTIMAGHERMKKKREEIEANKKKKDGS